MIKNDYYGSVHSPLSVPWVTTSSAIPYLDPRVPTKIPELDCEQGSRARFAALKTACLWFSASSEDLTGP